MSVFPVSWLPLFFHFRVSYRFSKNCRSTFFPHASLGNFVHLHVTKAAMPFQKSYREFFLGGEGGSENLKIGTSIVTEDKNFTLPSSVGVLLIIANLTQYKWPVHIYIISITIGFHVKRLRPLVKSNMKYAIRMCRTAHGQYQIQIYMPQITGLL